MLKWTQLMQLVRECAGEPLYRYRANGKGPCTVWQEGTIYVYHASETIRYSTISTEMLITRFGYVDERMDPVARALIDRLAEAHAVFSCTSDYDEDRDMVRYRFTISEVRMDAPDTL